MVEFFFTPEQRIRAYEEGLRRQAVNRAKALQGRNRAPADGPEAQAMHLLGAAGEMAVAVYLGMEEHLYKDELPVRGSCDLPGIDVKTRKKHWYDLPIQLDDDSNKIFVLVTIQDKRTFIHGWITGTEGMQADWVQSFCKGRPCYAVPKYRLHSIEELKCQLAVASTEKTVGSHGKEKTLF